MISPGIRKNLAFSLFLLVFFGCGDDRPSDAVTSETIRKIAESEITEGMEVSNFKRYNGQVDTDSVNRYKVTYTYDLRLTKPMAEVVLDNAAVLHNSRSANVKRETGIFFDPMRLENNLNDMQTTIAANQWLQNQAGKFEARRDAFLSGCASCLKFLISEDIPNEAKSRQLAFISSWMYYEELGFKDDSRVGDSVPRQAWATFSKTEKGWQAN